MHELFETLSRPNLDWSLDFNTKKDFQEVKSIEPEIPRDINTVNRLQDYLQNRIKDILTGSSCTDKQYEEVSNQISLLYFCDGKHFHLFKFVAKLRSFLNHLPSYSTDLVNWKSAHRFIQLYLYTWNYRLNSLDLYKENETIAKAVKKLRKKHFKVTIHDGEAQLDEKSFQRLLDGIEYRKEQLGSLLNDAVLNIADTTFNNRTGRYYLRKEINIGEVEPQTPLGYLYNLSLTNLKNVKRSNKSKAQLKEIIELSRDLMTIGRFQRLNYFESIFSSENNILTYLRKNLIYDQAFTIPQISNKNANKIIYGLFNNKIIKNLEVDLSIYLDIYNEFYSRNAMSKLLFTPNEIYLSLLPQYTKKSVEAAVNTLTFDEKTINRDYIDPFKTQSINYFNKPFIKSFENYFYLNPNFHVTGFITTIYEKLINTLKKQKRKPKEIAQIYGDLSELFVANLFKQRNIEYRQGLEYKLQKGELSEINHQATGGECDFIIETPDKIILIEQKTQTLTSKSREGDVVTGLLNLARSLLSSLEQAGRHEYILRTKGFLKFTDGSILELKGRKIEKVALTLFDFLSLSDVSSIRGILMFLMNKEISYSGDSRGVTASVKEINSTMEKIRNQYRSQVFRNEYLMDNNFLVTQDNLFLSANQLITLLDACKNNQDFSNLLGRTKCIANNTQDWFVIFDKLIMRFHEQS
ncbi:hypothetical protein L3081_25250 [Colwellia sp. MSW7]|uniref:NERD domain-containing protein n=1 Tax=Colwellia maritima TaxID=2912588 RepID=A0ABS9X7C9_9GAMM|nr:hypothetical protein [Colwellia maritima]MCI2286129.1 hypothetical protein [Colwellia maritima]